MCSNFLYSIKRGDTLSATDIRCVTLGGAIEQIEHSSARIMVTLVSGEVLQLAQGNMVAFPKKRPISAT